VAGTRHSRRLTNRKTAPNEREHGRYLSLKISQTGEKGKMYRRVINRRSF
jgi:hypothetical protein